MGYLYLMMVFTSPLYHFARLLTETQGVIISSAVLPATLTLMWDKQNLAAATLSPILGLASSLIAWLVTAKKQYGNLSVASTGAKYVLNSNPNFCRSKLILPTPPSNPMLAGNVVALLSPIVFIPILTYAFGPQNYDYKSMSLIRLGNDEDIAAAADTDVELIPGASNTSASELAFEQQKLKRASIIAKSLTGIMTVALLVLWPMPMYGTGYIFSKKFFTGWVSVGILWLFCSAFCVGLFPLWEGRGSMANTMRGIVRDLSGKRGAKLRGRVVEGREESASPPLEKEGNDEKTSNTVSEKASG